MLKNHVILAVLFISLAFISCTKRKDEMGRYQLFQGYYEALVESNGEFEGHDIKAIFKIDTETGQVWKYGELVRTDTVIRAFTRVATDPQISFKDLLK